MASLSVSVSDVINRDAGDVWEFVSDPRNQDQWVDGMSNSQIVGDGPIGRGTQIRGTYSFEGNVNDLTLTITEFREARVVAIESSDGPFPFTGRLSLERQGPATLVSNVMTVGSDSAFTSVMFTLLRPLSKWFFKRQVSKELRQLKAILEGD